MKNRVGPYVIAEDFFGREEELHRLAELLQAGEHLSLVAQRRIGKTSLLHEAARRMAAQYTCIYVDLQGSRDGADAIVALAVAARAHTALWSRVRNAFANVVENVESVGTEELQIKLRNGLVGDWRTKGDRILADLAAAEPPVVLMFDELPILLVRLLRDPDGKPRADGREHADQLLSWLRRCAIAHSGTLRIVVTGSIGLEPVARQVGLSGTLNVYRPVALEPWTPSLAIAALGMLAEARGVVLDTDAAEEVVALLGSCIPYHVQLFFSQLEEDARRRRTLHVDRLAVARVYETRMLSSHGHAELAHMEERLRLLVDPALLPLTLDLLTEASLEGSLTTRAALRVAEDHLVEAADGRRALQDIFGVLEHDGYLERSPDDARRFVSKLLRDWWRRRFGEFHIAAAKRDEK